MAFCECQQSLAWYIVFVQFYKTIYYLKNIEWCTSFSFCTIGTFVLAEYLEAKSEKYRSGKILELGAACGALSMFMCLPPRSFDVVTSDIEDLGEVEENIKYNFELNGMHIFHFSPPLFICSYL